MSTWLKSLNQMFSRRKKTWNCFLPSLPLVSWSQWNSQKTGYANWSYMENTCMFRWHPSWRHTLFWRHSLSRATRFPNICVLTSCVHVQTCDHCWRKSQNYSQALLHSCFWPKEVFLLACTSACHICPSLYSTCSPACKDENEYFISNIPFGKLSRNLFLGCL